MYKVIRMFDDLTDFSETKDGKAYHRYEIGDVYPRVGHETTKERIEELSGAKNLQGMPLIEEVEEAPKPAPKKTTTRKTVKK